MEYWQIIAEIDANYFALDEIQKQIANRDTITKMIDHATGHDRELSERGLVIAKRIKELQDMLPPDDPHFKATA